MFCYCLFINILLNYVYFSQLFYDGHHNLAVELSTIIRADPPCPPSDKLLHLTIDGLRNEMPRDQNMYTDIICGIDLEYETEGTSLAPEPSTYETAYVTSHKQACRSGAFSHDGQLVATGSVDASIKVHLYTILIIIFLLLQIHKKR